MNHAMKRALSVLMALAMVLTLIPAWGHTHAHAEEVEQEIPAATEENLTESDLPTDPELENNDLQVGTFAVTPRATTTDFSGSTVADLGISATNATGSGNVAAPEASWTASGNTISGSLVGAQGKGSGILWNGFYYESTTVLTLTNNKTTQAQLSFMYSATTSGSAFGDITIKKGTVQLKSHTSSVTNQEISETLEPGETITITLHVPQRKQPFSMPAANGASISISGLQLTTQGGVKLTLSAAENGTYTVAKADGTAVTVPGEVSLQTTDRLTLTAVPAEGYAFAGWYNQATGEYFSADLTCAMNFTEDSTVVPMFMLASDGIYGVGNTVFTDLTAAAQAASLSSVKTVVLLKSATLTGTHTIPGGVTLLIPYNAEHSLNTTDPDSVTVDHNSTSAANYVKYEKPSAFRTLTMATGSELIVNGSVSVNAKHESCVGGQIYGGQVLGKYGEIKMEGNAKITLKNGSNLYAWGYIWGSGTVEALAGSAVYEKMQVTDYRGGTNTLAIAYRNGSEKKDGAFPFSQYYVQNVEVKEVFHAGSRLMAHAAVNLAGESPEEAAVEFFGSSSAVFSITNGTLSKEYNPSGDRLILSVDGNSSTTCSINGMSLSMGILSINSDNYVLPINGNFDININAGTATVNQELVLQPGVKVTVAEGATLVNNDNVYIMDIDQWGAFVFSGKRQQPVVYAPSLNGGSSRTLTTDAVMDINGTANVVAGVYTTAGGASIITSQGTGVINFNVSAAGDSTVAQLTGGSDVNNINVTSAQLKNGGLNGTTFTATKGAASGTKFLYCANCEVWYSGTHTCAPTTVEVTWMNGTSTIYTDAEVAYNTVPQFKAEDHPISKASDAAGHYTFAGWSLTDGGEALANLPAVTENTTFYSVFTAESHNGTDDGNCATEVKCSCGYVTVPAKSHSFTVKQSETKATCMATGSILWKCANCNATDTETLPTDSNNHTKQNTTVKGAEEATCGADGYTGDTYCECGVKIADGETIPATGAHVYATEVSRTEATCMATGSLTKKCACGAENTEILSVDPGNHESAEFTYTENEDGETHTKAHKCCDTVIDPAEAHEYVEGLCACGAEEPVKNIKVIAKGSIPYTVSGQVVTVTH